MGGVGVGGLVVGRRLGVGRGSSLNVNYLAIGILGVLGSVGVGLMSNELMDCWVVGYYYSK